MRRDQRINGGQWVALGDFDLAPSSSHRVELSDDAQAYVLADAVRFERLGDSRLVQADAVNPRI